MISKSKISMLFTAAFAAGCSQLHTDDFKEIKKTNADASDDIDELKAKTVAAINSGSTIDEIFVKTTPIKLAVSPDIVSMLLLESLPDESDESDESDEEDSPSSLS